MQTVGIGPVNMRVDGRGRFALLYLILAFLACEGNALNAASAVQMQKCIWSIYQMRRLPSKYEQSNIITTTDAAACQQQCETNSHFPCRTFNYISNTKYCGFSSVNTSNVGLLEASSNRFVHECLLIEEIGSGKRVLADASVTSTDAAKLTDGTAISCTSYTISDGYAWLALDLGKLFIITQIKLSAKTKIGLANLNVSLGNELNTNSVPGSSFHTCATTGSPDALTVTLNCAAQIPARYLLLNKTTVGETISLCDVQVYGHPYGCGKFPRLVNSNVKTTSGSFETRSIWCSSSYRFKDGSTSYDVHCDLHNQWQPVPLYCRVQCPRDFIRFNDDRCFYLHEKQLTRPAASALCKEFGGYLARLSNDRWHKDWIKIKFQRSGDVWIGLKIRREVFGVFRWEIGKPATWSNWKSSEPSKPEYKCVSANSDGDFEWKSENCLTELRPICEFKPTEKAMYWPDYKDIKYERKDYYCYTYNSEKKTYSSARSSCKAKGGDLAVVDSSTISSLINTYMRPANSYYIGLSDQAVETAFRWVDGFMPAWSNWKSGEPDDGSDKNCVFAETNGEWKDGDCSDDKPFMCQKPGCPPPPVVLHTTSERMMTSAGHQKIKYTCKYKFTTPNGDSTFTSECTCEGVWTDPQNCSGICPIGFEYYAPNATCFMVTNTNAGGAQLALNACSSKGTSSTTFGRIYGQNHKDFLLSKFPDLRAGGRSYYVGLSLNSQDKYWRWPDGTIAVDFDGWNPAWYSSGSHLHAQIISGGELLARTATDGYYGYALCEHKLSDEIIHPEHCPAGKCDHNIYHYCYVRSSQYFNWTNAEAFCHSKGGRLATFPDDAAQSTIVKSLSYPYDFWIGLNALDTPRVYRWQDSSLLHTTFSYKYSFYYPKYDCVVINSVSQIRTGECSHNKRAVCEILGCSAPPFVENASNVTSLINGIPAATYTCKTGAMFQAVTSRTSKCNCAFQWIPRVPACREIPVVVGFWPFNSLTNLTDVSGNGQHMQAMNMSMCKGIGPFGQDDTLYKFSESASLQKLAINTSTSLHVRYSFTVMFYIHLISSCSSTQCSVVQYIPTTWVSYFRVTIDNSGQQGQVNFIAYDLSTRSDVTVVSNLTLPLKEWVHIAITYDYDQGDLILFKNGSLYYQQAIGSYKEWDTAGGITVGGTNHFHGFQGHLQCLRIQSNALSESELTTAAADCSSQVCPDGYIHRQGSRFCYKDMGTATTYPAGKTMCKESGAELLSLRSYEETKWLNETFTRSNYWLAASSERLKGVFEWSENDPITWAEWDRNQPSASGSCVFIARATGLWSNYDCTRTTRAMCKLSLGITGLSSCYQTESPVTYPEVFTATPPFTRCRFPFDYNGQRYKACTTIDSQGESWCMTQVNSSTLLRANCRAEQSIPDLSQTMLWLSTEKSNWTSAEKTCNAFLGGSLAVANSSAELTQLKEFATSANMPERKSYWIGLVELGNVGVFRWLDGSVMSFDNWADGHPARYSTGGPYCGMMSLENGKLIYTSAVCGNEKKFACLIPEVTTVGETTSVTTEESTTTEMDTTTSSSSQPLTTGSPAPFCGVPPRVTGAVAAKSPLHTTFDIGTIIDYVCEKGLLFNDGMTEKVSKCTQTGQWTPVASSCDLYCQIPPAVNFSKIISYDLHVGGFAMYECITGFQFENGGKTAKPTCGSDRQWVGLPASGCKAILCPTPAAQNATVSFSGHTNGSSAKFACLPGHIFPDKSATHSATCIYGTWLPPSTSCQEKTCGPLPTVDNATPDVMEKRYGTNVIFTCKLGFRFLDKTTRKNVRCSENRIWEPTSIPHCEAIWCLRPPTVAASSNNASGEVYIVGQSVEYKCNNGVYFSDGKSTQLSTCTIHSNWTKVDATCQEKCTQPPLQFPNAYIEEMNVQKGGVTNYRCNPGFWFSDKSTTKAVRCENNLSWQSISTEGCKKLSCDGPPAVVNATREGIIKASYSYGDTFLYTCHGNTRIADGSTNQTITCGEEGAWIPQSVECSDTPCPVLSFANAYTDSDDRTYGSVVTVACDYGYVFRDDGSTNRTVICIEQGEWSAEVVDCVSAECPRLADESISTRFGSVYEDRCTAGKRHTDGSLTAKQKCIGAAEWWPVLKDCAAPRCSALPYIDHSSVSYYTSDVGIIAVFRCNIGYRHEDGQVEKSLLCSNTQQVWVGEARLCSMLTCPPVPRSNHSSPNTTLAVFNSRVEYQCVRAYHFPGLQPLQKIIIYCNENGSWSETVPDCIETRCQALDNLTGVNVTNYVSNKVDASATLTCAAGTRLLDGREYNTIYCQTNGEWSGRASGCQAGRCSPVPHVTNARPDTIDADPNTTITYNCTHAHTLQGNIRQQSIQCVDGNWIGQTNPCSLVHCPSLYDSDNGNSTYNSTYNAYNTYVARVCIRGYEMKDGSKRKILKCLENAEWENGTEFCKPIICPPVPLVQNATTNTTQRTFGTLVQYSCIQDHEFPDRKRTKVVGCQADKTWSVTLPNCRLVQCRPLRTWNGVIVSNTDVTLGTSVNYSCAQDFHFPRSVDVTVLTADCNANGSWVPSIVDCLEYVDPNKNKIPPTESDKAIAIGTIVVIVLVSVAGCLVLLDIPKIILDLRNAFGRDNVLNRLYGRMFNRRIAVTRINIQDEFLYGN